MVNNTPKLQISTRLWLIGGSMALLILILDQLTKWLILKFQAGRPPTEVIPGLLRLVYTTNPGAAWGILADHTILLAFISLVVMIFLIWRFPRMTEGWPERVLGLATLIGGIAGNLVDRFFRREVIDFIDIHFRGHHWPAFNVADSAICIGIGVYMISIFIRQSSQDKQVKNSEITAK